MCVKTEGNVGGPGHGGRDAKALGVVPLNADAGEVGHGRRLARESLHGKGALKLPNQLHVSAAMSPMETPLELQACSAVGQPSHEEHETPRLAALCGARAALDGAIVLPEAVPHVVGHARVRERACSAAIRSEPINHRRC